MSTLEERKAALLRARVLLEELAALNVSGEALGLIRSRARGILRNLPRPDELVDVLAIAHKYANDLRLEDAAQPRPAAAAATGHERSWRAEEMRYWLAIGTLLSVAVGFAVSAGLTETEGGAMAKAIWLGLGAVLSVGFGLALAGAWLKERRDAGGGCFEGDYSFIDSPAWSSSSHELEDAPSFEGSSGRSEPSSPTGRGKGGHEIE